MGHLSEELIISWINGDLPDAQVREAKKHIDHCNECFLNFSDLKKNNEAMSKYLIYLMTKKFKDYKEPEELFGKVKKLINFKEYYSNLDLLQEEKRKTFTEKIFIGLTKPGPALYTAVAALLIVLIMIPISLLREEVDEQLGVPEIMTPSGRDKLEGIEVTIENRELKISQPIKFKRELKVYNESGELILDTEFERLNNAFTLNEKGGGKLRVVIYSLDEIVYDELVEYNNN